MQFAILGPLEVTHEGGRVPLGGQRQRAVLARLLLDAGHVVSTDRLIDDVWDGRPPATAQKTLQKYVSELRKALGPEMVHTESGGYVLAIDPGALDAIRFERFVDEGRFEPALALWRGDVLADLDDLAFVGPEQTRLDALRLAAVEGRLQALLDAGRHAEVVGELAEAAATHPLHERFAALHMLALYRSGRQVEALRAFDAHRKRLSDEVGVEPAVELRALEAAILRQDPALDLQVSAPQVGNLPMPLTSFVGRAADLEAIAQEVFDNRFLTLTGPGGVGKTRLAVQLGSEISDRYPGGVWLVDLAGVRNGDLVPDAVATALGIDVRHAPDVYVALVSAHANRPACMLVLDNCEHLVEATREFVTRILQLCANASVLATSRRPIGVQGEYVRPVLPLSHDEGVSLFVQRARLAGARDLSAKEVDEICTRLDLLPLAIELAASQLRVLGLVEIAARLQDQLQFIGSASDASPRQRTLNDMVAWSHDLLPPDTQAAFARLGVFPSSFTLEAADAVCGAGALGHITTLVDHSLLVRTPSSTASVSRYRMLETLRLFAHERLADIGPHEVDRVRRIHAEHYRQMAQSDGRNLWGPQERVWRVKLEAEEPNLHAALGWAEDNDPELALRLAVALWPYWDLRWGERKGVAYVESVLAKPDLDVADELRAWALTVAADLSAKPGDARSSVPWATEASAMFRKLRDDEGLRRALIALGSGLGNEGRLDEADAALDEAVDIALRHNDKVVVARALNQVAYIAARRGDFARAAEVHRDELARWIELGSLRGEATDLRLLAVDLLTLGEIDEADQLAQRALAIWTELDDPTSIAHVRATLGDIARTRGDLERASELYSAAMEGFDAVGDRRCTASTFKNFGVIAARRGEHGRSDELFRRGLELRYELGDEAGLAECLEGLAGAYLGTGRAADAALLLGAAHSLREATGSSVPSDAKPRLAGLTEASRAALGMEAFDRAWEAGSQCCGADVMEFIEKDVDSRTPVRYRP